jgi:hypothetical protein
LPFEKQGWIKPLQRERISGLCKSIDVKTNIYY